MNDKPCRSKSPAGVPCSRRPRGHGGDHRDETRKWEGGINTRAYWARVEYEDTSEANYQALRYQGLWR